DPELRRNTDALRGGVQRALCLVARPLRSPRWCSPAMRVRRRSRVGRRRSIPAPPRRRGRCSRIYGDWRVRPSCSVTRTTWHTARAVAAILPGGAQHEHYRQWLDRFADYVNGLRATVLVPVIFRPFHETSGGWFWWGARHATPDEYKQLWRFTVEYLRDRR